MLEGNQMSYQELNGPLTTAKTWLCAGSVKFDKTTGKTYECSLEGRCTGASVDGGVSLKGTGAGTLP
jgi:hypothetical protein